MVDKTNQKIAAITEISFFENNMIQKIFVVPKEFSWKDVYLQYLQGKEDYKDDYISWIVDMPDDLEEAREELCNGEVDVVVTFMELT